MEFGINESLDDHLDNLVAGLIETEQRGCLRVALRQLRPWEMRSMLARNLSEGYEPTARDARAAKFVEVDGQIGLLARDVTLPEVRIHPDAYAALTRLAEEAGRSVESEVRAALERHLM